jgi:predicted kinase
MHWTEGAKAAVEHALIQTDGDTIDAAIAYAEQLAEHVGARIVDTDVWLQALIHTRRTQRRQHPHSAIADVI